MISTPLRRLRKLAVLVPAAAVVAGVLAVPVSAAGPTTTGTWYSHPTQTSTTSTQVTTGFAYKTAVRQPINADGSSNFKAKRGVIPAQFDLLSAPTTVTTTTKTYAPPVWESINSTGSVSYAGLDLDPSAALTVNDITNLSATYDFTTGDCYGGSLRWDIYLGSPANLINVYYGTPNGPDQGCSGANSESGDNLITTGITPNRFGINNGGSYVTWADVLAATNNGTDKVLGAQLTLDSGWKGDQIANVSDVTVNDNTWVPTTIETSTSSVAGDFAKTCSLPAAELRWAKNDGTATGGVNEADSVQPKDTGQFYRQVDCKYIYNLDVSSLSGVGTYTVWARIGGINVQVPATFDLE